MKTFARRLSGYLDGIVAHCRWPLHTNLVEGVNNKIKVIKRMAHGVGGDTVAGGTASTVEPIPALR